jgi:hypothetical protein
MTDAHAHDDHDHGDHAGHSHAPTVTHESERKVFWVMLLTGGFMLAEVIGGLVSGCWDRSRPSSRRWSLCGPGGRPSTRSSRRPWSC